MEHEEIAPDRSLITQEQVESELERFNVALAKAGTEIERLLKKTETDVGSKEAEIFNAQLDVLHDPEIQKTVSQKIGKDHKNSEIALVETETETCAMLDALDDEYLRERSADVHDVCRILLYALKGISPWPLRDIEGPAVIVAKGLSPSDTVGIDTKRVRGIVTEEGGATSHAAILARNMGLPSIVGLTGILKEIKTGDMLIMDGMNGILLINPAEETLEDYRKKEKAVKDAQVRLASLKECRAVTTDGVHAELYANIGGSDDLDAVLKSGAEGIGLFRTEFLFIKNSFFPTENEQFAVYRDVVKKMGKPVIVRTLDIGGDKKLPYFQFPAEENPFLGWRAIRLCLARRDIFKIQLRALLRASVFGDLRIMYPMISSVDELTDANALVEECKQELEREKIPFRKDIQIGMMVETPAAVLCADDFARRADFFSIGTNDLTQYTLAADRGNERVAYLYDPFHPAVLRSIRQVIEAAHRVHKPVGVCGEFASDPRGALLLLGLGLDEWSISASMIPYVKDAIRGVSHKKAVDIAQKALKLETAHQIKNLLQQSFQ